MTSNYRESKKKKITKKEIKKKIKYQFKIRYSHRKFQTVVHFQHEDHRWLFDINYFINFLSNGCFFSFFSDKMYYFLFVCFLAFNYNQISEFIRAVEIIWTMMNLGKEANNNKKKIRELSKIGDYLLERQTSYFY